MITHEAMFLGGNRSHSEIERFLADPVGWSAMAAGSMSPLPYLEIRHDRGHQ
jgi:hypothetical protein